MLCLGFRLGIVACVPVVPVDPYVYQANLEAASNEDFHDRDRERRSAAEAYRASGQEAPVYHFHEHRNNFNGW